MTKHKILAEKISISFVLLLSILYIVLTIHPDNIWADAVRFYTYTLQFAPDSARLHNNLGMSLANEGNVNEAIVQYKKALAFCQGYPQIYNNLGNADMTAGDYTDAEINLKKALQLSLGLVVVKNNLIRLYLLTEQFDKARVLSKNNSQVEQIIQSQSLQKNKL